MHFINRMTEQNQMLLGGNAKKTPLSDNTLFAHRPPAPIMPLNAPEQMHALRRTVSNRVVTPVQTAYVSRIAQNKMDDPARIKRPTWFANLFGG